MKLLSIESDLPSFKPLAFRDGLNILLSDKSPGSGEKKTRNSAGKSSFVELFHFLTGGRAKGSLASHDALAASRFFATFEVGGRKIQISRGAADANLVHIVSGEAEQLGVKAKKDKKTQLESVTNEVWKDVLGHYLFGLPLDPDGTSYSETFTPSTRALVSYFARRRGGFMRANESTEQQQPWDWQVNLSYLIGLDWNIPKELELVRRRERQLGELRKAAKGGAVGKIIGTVAELRPRIVRLESEVLALRDDVANFRVVDTYREWSDNAAGARMEMLAIEREAVTLKQTLAHVEEALTDETPPEPIQLERLYDAVGIELPGTAIRRFEEVREFHQSVIANRRARLETEATELRAKIADGEGRVRTLDDFRSNILRSLAGGGAFEDLVALQAKLAQKDAELSSLQERYKSAEILEGETTELEIDRANLKRRLQADHQAREGKLERVIGVVGDLIGHLYDDRAGAFVIEATDAGPAFDIKIEGDRGGGIAQMEIFCLDIALLRASDAEHGGPKLLIHDSHLFDGVDERQIAEALVLGASAAREVGGQYIVTMNSDVYARLPFPKDFDREGVVVPTRLSDAGEDGGLFGIRFD